MEHYSSRKMQQETDTESVGSECSLNHSRSTTPFVLRSHCQHENKDCPEGHGLEFRSRLSVSPKRSSKKSLKHTMTKLNGNIVKDLRNHFQLNCQSNKVATTASKLGKKLCQTSDYSSAEEENIKNGCKIHTSVDNPNSHLLPRSAEKTDFTYARSYSYRSEVTPERVIVMPNMTRRSIEANRIPTMGDTYCSPDLGYRSRNTVCTSEISSNIFQKSKACSYGTDYESDHELENSSTCYRLNAPSTPRHHIKRAHTYWVLRKLQEYLFNVCWWIYLATCYSLLADTCMLQTKLFCQLRSSCRHHKKVALLFILFFFLLPPILAAGGWLLSVLHGLTSSSNEHNTFEKPLSSQSPVEFIDPLSFPSAYVSSGQSEKLKLNTDHLIEMQGSIAFLQEKFIEMEKKVTRMTSELDLYQNNLILLETLSTCCEKSSPATITSVMEDKWNNLISQMFQGTGTTLSEVIDFVKSIRRTVEHTEEIKLKIEKENEKTHQTVKDLQLELTEAKRGISKEVLNQFEQRILEVSTGLQSKWREEMEKIISTEIGKQLDKQVYFADGHPTRKEVESIVRSILTRYDEDKTGMADYALEPAGGVILSTRCTESFSGHRPRLSIWGFSLWSEPNNPRVVIQPGLVPGRCWSFRGFDGYLVVQLSRNIYPTAFSLEHIPKSLAPDNQIDSAPKNFTVYGLQKESDTDGILLGSYFYDQNGDSLQTFPVQHPNHGAYSIVELRIHSNHGNMNYTCLYRFRVHGRVAH